MLDAFESNLIQHFIIFQVCCATLKFSNVSFEHFFDNGMFFSETICKQICSKEKLLNSWQRRKSAWQLSQVIQKIIPTNREIPSKNKLRRKVLRRLTRNKNIIEPFETLSHSAFVAGTLMKSGVRRSTTALQHPFAIYDIALIDILY